MKTSFCCLEYWRKVDLQRLLLFLRKVSFASLTGAARKPGKDAIMALGGVTRGSRVGHFLAFFQYCFAVHVYASHSCIKIAVAVFVLA